EWARSIRARHYITLDCVKLPEKSPWMDTWRNGTDLNFVNLTSLTRSSFCQLLERFAPHYYIVEYSRKGGRPSRLRYHHQVLGLLLCFYVGSMHGSNLCQQFGVPPSTMNRALNAAEAALATALKGYAPARIVWPSFARQKALARLIWMRQPMIAFTWGFLDGKNYKVQKPSDAVLQNAQYNGWLHNTFVTGTLCFSADGLIVWANHNCPGSWNDGDMSLAFRRCLMDRELNSDQRFGVIADSAFPCSDEMTGRILTPLKEGNLNALIPTVRYGAKAKSAAITSIRQSAEWGMGSVEKVYHRLLLPLPYNRDQRQLRLDNLFRMSNYRVRTVGISEIRTTFVHGPEDRRIMCNL
ncbi:hypothetical protein PHMEG_00027907, partial [Phytophthora megakarya]